MCWFVLFFDCYKCLFGLVLCVLVCVMGVVCMFFVCKKKCDVCSGYCV